MCSGSKVPANQVSATLVSRPYNPVTHDAIIWRSLHQGTCCSCPPPSLRAHTRPLMRLHGGRIGLQCGIAVAVVQGFALGPNLQGTTLTGRGDSSIPVYRCCDGTVWFFIPPCTSKKQHMFYTQHAHMFQCCFAQLLGATAAVCVYENSEALIAGAQQALPVPWRCLGRSQPC